MEKLVQGIHRFRANYFSKNKELFESLAAGQQPETLFITCSDSRVVPNLITSAAPGELFIVRNVGNIVPSVERGLVGGVAAAIEYAVEVLKVQNLIVCGHTDCGAIAAILEPQKVAQLRFVPRWVDQASEVRTVIEKEYAHLDPEHRLAVAVEENVLGQLENLRTYDFVQRRLEDGALKLNGWVFKVSTGEVFNYDPDAEQFVLLGGDPRVASR